MEKIRENEGVNVKYFELNKDFFYDKYDDSEKAKQEYYHHQIKAINLVRKMRINFKAIRVIANLRLFEIPFYKIIVKNLTKSINLLKEPPEKWKDGNINFQILDS